MVLSLTALASGCDYTCEQGFELARELNALEAQVSAAAAQPDTTARACINFTLHWNPWLKEAAEKANNLAESQFTRRNEYCAFGHYERDCHHRYRRSHPHGTPSGGDHVGGRGCDQRYVCDLYESDVRHSPGYTEAKNIAQNLGVTRELLSQACTVANVAHPVLSKPHLVLADATLTKAQADVSSLLVTAGCYGQKGK